MLRVQSDQIAAILAANKEAAVKLASALKDGKPLDDAARQELGERRGAVSYLLNVQYGLNFGQVKQLLDTALGVGQTERSK